MHSPGAAAFSTPVLLFDLGDTLVGYYSRSEFPPILQEAIQEVKKAVQAEGLPVLSDEAIARGVQEENYHRWSSGLRQGSGRPGRYSAMRRL